MATSLDHNSTVTQDRNEPTDKAAEIEMQECSLGDDCTECQQCNEARKRALNAKKQHR